MLFYTFSGGVDPRMLSISEEASTTASVDGLLEGGGGERIYSHII